MFPESFQLYFSSNQDLLYFITLALDLGFTVLMYRFFGRYGLLACIVLSILLANLQGPKLTVIFGMETSLGVIFYSSIFFATDLMSEKFGKKAADNAVMMGFSVSAIILIMLSISLLFLPSTQNQQTFSSEVHESFVRILDFTPRFIFGSLFAYLISQRFDVWCFHKIKAWTNGRHLWLRNNLSTMASQTVDTTLYALVVWWGVVDLEQAISLGLAKMVFKIAIAAFDTPFIYWARSWSVKNS
ncbi:MAG: queuosine precursor transporter [Gammaproteobacteria bacterium]|nr:queuosine precursor transporter [Gammaproteobacteria bacterium]